MRKECQIKTFDGLGPFSYVCRMISFEPDTTETHTGEDCVNFEDLESDFESCGPQLETSERSLTEKFIENHRHYVCTIDEVSHEHFRGFPVEIDLEGPQDGDEEDSGYVPTPEQREKSSCPRVQEIGKKLFLQILDQIFQKSLKNPSC